MKSTITATVTVCKLILIVSALSNALIITIKISSEARSLQDIPRYPSQAKIFELMGSELKRPCNQYQVLFIYAYRTRAQSAESLFAPHGRTSSLASSDGPMMMEYNITL